MKWLFISRSRHQTEIQLWQRLLDEKYRRIHELEAERKLLWDKICLLGIGAPMFTPIGVEEPKPPSEMQSKPANPVAPMPRRPSAIMRRMDRLAEERWLRKQYPSQANNKEVAAMFDKIDQEAGKRP